MMRWFMCAHDSLMLVSITDRFGLQDLSALVVVVRFAFLCRIVVSNGECENAPLWAYSFCFFRHSINWNVCCNLDSVARMFRTSFLRVYVSKCLLHLEQFNQGKSQGEWTRSPCALTRANVCDDWLCLDTMCTHHSRALLSNAKVIRRILFGSGYAPKDGREHIARFRSSDGDAKCVCVGNAHNGLVNPVGLATMVEHCAFEHWHNQLVLVIRFVLHSNNCSLSSCSVW